MVFSCSTVHINLVYTFVMLSHKLVILLVQSESFFLNKATVP